MKETLIQMKKMSELFESTHHVEVQESKKQIAELTRQINNITLNTVTSIDIPIQGYLNGEYIRTEITAGGNIETQVRFDDQSCLSCPD